MKIIKEILHNIRPEVDFTESLDFIGDGLLDSLDIIRLVSEMDSQFSISIDGSDIIPENFRSLASLQELVKKYQNMRGR